MNIVKVSENGFLCEYDGVHMLFDGDISHIITNTTPQTYFNGIDPSTIDVIFISSYVSLSSVVYMTQYSSFHGCIYATIPTISLGQWYLSDLKCFHHVDITTCLNSIVPVAYGECVKLSRFSASLSVTAYSSGFSLGSCNWLLHGSGHKIGVMCASSTLVDRHPTCANWDAFCNIDVLIVKDVAAQRGDDMMTMLKQLRSVVHSATRGGKTVVLSAVCTNVVYDVLVELNCDVKFVCDFGRETLKYANALPEWMSDTVRAPVYRATEPLKFSNVAVIRGDDDLRSHISKGCVVVCTGGRHSEVFDFVANKHPDFGVLVVTFEPTQRDLSIAPYRFQRVHHEVDPRLSIEEVSHLINTTLLPKEVVVVSSCVLNLETQVHHVDENQQLHIQSIAPLYERASISTALVNSEKSKAFVIDGRSVRASRLCATLNRADNSFHVDSCPRTSENTTRFPMVWGDVAVDELVNKLRLCGYADAKHSSSEQVVVVSVESIGAQVHLSPRRTLIKCDNPQHRQALHNVVSDTLCTL